MTALASGAPAASDALADRILAAIAHSSSKRPARAADIAAQLGGDEQPFWAALEQLRRGCAINTAHIQRGADPAPLLAIWPTGLPVAHHSWRDLNGRGGFAVHHTDTPRRFPQSPAARRQTEENTMSKTSRSRTSGQDRRDRIAELVCGRPLEQGLTYAEVARKLGLSPQGVGYLIEDMLGGLRVARGCLPGERANRLYDPAAAIDHSVVPAEMVEVPAATTPPAVPAANVVAGLAAIADALGDMEPADDIDIGAAAAQVADAPRVQLHFALWDDGGLSIYDGDDLLQIAPADVARLARLIGGPGRVLTGEVAA